MKNIFFTFLFFILVSVGYSQVLISLLFGEKLNSPNIEFGLDGGINWSTIDGLESSDYFRKLNLGFYFTFKLKQSAHWFLRTGVMVKSDRGIDDLSVNDIQQIDSTFLRQDQGHYHQEIGYFDVPILLRYKFNFKGFLEFGPQMSLKNGAALFFNSEQGNDELTIERSNKDQINTFDAGLLLGAGYCLREAKGLSFEIWFYHGFTDVYKKIAGTSSESMTLKVTLPIGSGKKIKKEI